MILEKPKLNLKKLNLTKHALKRAKGRFDIVSEKRCSEHGKKIPFNLKSVVYSIPEGYEVM